jgi:hypothetical protein
MLGKHIALVDTPWPLVPKAVVRSRPAAGKILNHHPLAWAAPVSYRSVACFRLGAG